MKEWYQPDERWARVGINSREEYVQAYVFAGRFHADVPADVVQAYETVSHLLAQAWYYYPLYDEALAKLLFLQEMAIKLRCKQVGIAATYRSNGKKRSHTLQTYIDALQLVEPAKAITAMLHRARDLRNHFAHPEGHSFAGGIFRHHILPLLNLLNDLFLPDALVAQATAFVGQLQQHRSKWGKRLLTLEWNDANILLLDANPLIAQQVQGNFRIIWQFSPILPNIVQVLAKQQIPKPLLLVLTDVKMAEDNIVGKDLKTGKAVQLKPIPAAHSELLRNPYEAAINQASAEDRYVVEVLQNGAVAEAWHELRYAYFWE
jgi:hypothetical protein